MGMRQLVLLDVGEEDRIKEGIELIGHGAWL